MMATEITVQKKRDYQRSWRTANKDKVSAWIEANKDKIKAYRVRRSQLPEVKIENAVRAKVNRLLATPEQKAKERHRSRLRRHHQRADLEWRGSISLEDWGKLRSDFSNKCLYCMKNESTDMDHIIPLSSGGSISASNIAPACRSCNMSKRSKDLFEWRPDLIGARSPINAGVSV